MRHFFVCGIHYFSALCGGWLFGYMYLGLFCAQSFFSVHRQACISKLRTSDVSDFCLRRGGASQLPKKSRTKGASLLQQSELDPPCCAGNLLNQSHKPFQHRHLSHYSCLTQLEGHHRPRILGVLGTICSASWGVFGRCFGVIWDTFSGDC